MRLRLNWQRTNDHPKGSVVGLTYSHTSGWTVRHCGHPTANNPYEVTNPAGRLVVAPNGLAFRTVATALDAVDAIRFGFWRLTPDGADALRVVSRSTR
jgi:hypothetical protein